MRADDRKSGMEGYPRWMEATRGGSADGVTELLRQHYEGYDEDGRLAKRQGRVEYLTTMRYIIRGIGGIGLPRVLEVGAGTGRYSIELARHGCEVTAIELLEHNLSQLRGKLDGTEPLTAMQGDARDLPFADGSFDATLLLGPMYHLFDRDDKLRALSEAVRVTRSGGHVLVAYCMNDPSVVGYCFRKGGLARVLREGLIDPSWQFVDQPQNVFSVVRVEDIDSLDAELPVDRVALVATDGMTGHYREMVDAMDDETFACWLEYHAATCERSDLVGMSHHTLDVLQRR